jgi:hypothetical protein
MANHGHMPLGSAQQPSRLQNSVQRKRQKKRPEWRQEESAQKMVRKIVRYDFQGPSKSIQKKCPKSLSDLFRSERRIKNFGQQTDNTSAKNLVMNSVKNSFTTAGHKSNNFGHEFRRDSDNSSAKNVVKKSVKQSVKKVEQLKSATSKNVFS